MANPVAGLPRFLNSVHRESQSVMAEYSKLKESGADLSRCADERVKELHHLIEQAEANQYYRKLGQRLDSESVTVSTVSPDTALSPVSPRAAKEEERAECDNSRKPALATAKVS